MRDKWRNIAFCLVERHRAKDDDEAKYFVCVKCVYAATLERLFAARILL